MSRERSRGPRTGQALEGDLPRRAGAIAGRRRVGRGSAIVLLGAGCLALVGLVARVGGERARPDPAPAGPESGGRSSAEAPGRFEEPPSSTTRPERSELAGVAVEGAKDLEPTLVLRFVSEVTGTTLEGVEFEVASERRSNRSFGTGVSGAEGLARLTGLPADVLLVRSKPFAGHAAAVRGLWYERDGVEVHEVRLEAGRSLLVRVVDDTGAPVERATVYRSDSDPRASFADEHLGTTDAAGELVVEHLASLAEQVWIEDGRAAPRSRRGPILAVAWPGVERGNGSRRWHLGVEEEWPEELVFELVRPTRVRAEVVEADGTPVTGARVAAGGSYRPPTEGAYRSEAWTDGAGRCRLEVPVPAGRWRLGAWLPGGGRSSELFDADPGGEVDVRFVVSSDLGLVVDPIDAVTGERVRFDRRESGSSGSRAARFVAPHRRERRWAFAGYASARIQDRNGWQRASTSLLDDGRILLSLEREARPGSLLILELRDHDTPGVVLPEGLDGSVRVPSTPLARWKLTLELFGAGPRLAGLDLRLGLCEHELPHADHGCSCEAGVDHLLRIPSGVASTVARVPRDVPLYVHAEFREPVEELLRVTKVPFGPFVPSEGDVRLQVHFDELVSVEERASRPESDGIAFADRPAATGAADLRSGTFLVRVVEAGDEDVRSVRGLAGTPRLSRGGEADGPSGTLWSAEGAPDPCPLFVLEEGSGMHWAKVRDWQPGVASELHLASTVSVDLRLGHFSEQELRRPLALEVRASGPDFSRLWETVWDRRCEDAGVRSFAMGLAPGSYLARWSVGGKERGEATFEVPDGASRRTVRLSR